MICSLARHWQEHNNKSFIENLYWMEKCQNLILIEKVNQWYETEEILSVHSYLTMICRKR